MSIVDFLAFFRGDKNKPDVEWQFIGQVHQGLCPDLFHQPTEGFLGSMAGALIGDHNITRDAFDRKMAGLPVLHRHRPLLGYVVQCQIEQFEQRLVAGKRPTVIRDFESR